MPGYWKLGTQVIMHSAPCVLYGCLCASPFVKLHSLSRDILSHLANMAVPQPLTFPCPHVNRETTPVFLSPTSGSQDQRSQWAWPNQLRLVGQGCY